MMDLDLKAGMLKAIEVDAGLEKNIAPMGADENEVLFSRRLYAEMRAHWNQEVAEVREVVDTPLPTRYGEVNCRIYYNGDETAPVLFYIHGGGFVVGSIDTHDRIQRLHAQSGHCNVVAIDYAKSPEVKCPHALHEVIDVVAHCHKNAKALKLNPDRFVIGGDSAGAHMSLATMIHFRDNGGAKIAGGLFYYGTFGLLDSPSMRQFADIGFGLSWQLMEFYKNMYLEKPEDALSPHFDLLRCDLSGLAPMLISGLALDPLRDDSRVLAETLKRIGADYKFTEYEGMLHGSMHYSKVLPDAYLMIADGVAFMWSQFREYGI